MCIVCRQIKYGGNPHQYFYWEKFFESKMLGEIEKKDILIFFLLWYFHLPKISRK